jgi:hypothetical protein
MTCMDAVPVHAKSRAPWAGSGLMSSGVRSGNGILFSVVINSS